jgi:hypothetical protein
MALAVVGLALGLAAAFAATRVMSTLLFETSPRDPVTFASVAGMLLASLWRRATSGSARDTG